MTRFDMLAVLLKAVGVYCGVNGLAMVVQTCWILKSQDRGSAGLGSQPFEESAYMFVLPAVNIFAAAVLVFAAGPVARLCGERPRPN